MRISMLLAVLALPAVAYCGSNKLIVHEWGTFTALQDETGRSIGGINVNDEPLPVFVHRIGPGLVSDDNGGKGLPVGLPDVTMRLETPVIYFYPPGNSDKIPIVNVSATFNGGLLTEFYPKAQLTIDGKPTTKPVDRITESVRGGLTWNNVTIGTNDPKPVTNSHVWQSPRNVDSSPIEVGKEAEQYIFYRGCGHIDSPLKVIREGDRIHVVAASRLKWSPRWLAEFRADGTCAFERLVDPNLSCAYNPDPSSPGTFAESDFTADHVTDLRNEMRQALIAAGLYEKEADAMLETWKLSYFKSPGQRLFYLVPREWTDKVLPLSISKPCKLTRVMVGRIELITPTQREAINQIIAAGNAKPNFNVPARIASLGRFGYAMIQDERARTSVRNAGK